MINLDQLEAMVREIDEAAEEGDLAWDEGAWWREKARDLATELLRYYGRA